MNKVYQHGDELFVTLDETPRMRNFRTGLTITPRVPFKYLGEMPQVGQVWALRSPCKSRFTVTKASGGDVTLDHPVFLVEITRLTELYKSFELVHPKKDVGTEPNFIFATGHKDALNAKAADRRFTAAEAEMRELYMGPSGKVWKIYSVGPTLLVLTDSEMTALAVTVDEFNALYRPLPLPGQLWGKGKRYVTVNRVKDGRVYYSGGASGLRRFLNEYRRVASKPSEFGTPDVVDAAKMFGRMLRPTPTDMSALCKPCHDAKAAERAFSQKCAEAALDGVHFSLKVVRVDGDTHMEFKSKEKFIEFCRAVASL